MSSKTNNKENVLILNGVRYTIVTFDKCDSPVQKVKSTKGHEVEIVKTKLVIEAIRVAANNDYRNETT